MEHGNWLATGVGLGIVATFSVCGLMSGLRRYAPSFLIGLGWLAVAQVVWLQGVILHSFVQQTRGSGGIDASMLLLLLGTMAFLTTLVAGVALAQKSPDLSWRRAFLYVWAQAVGAIWLGGLVVGNEANLRHLFGTEWNPYRPISTAFCYTLILAIPLLETLRGLGVIRLPVRRARR